MKKFIIRGLAATILVGMSLLSEINAQTVYQENSKTLEVGKRSFLANYVAWRKDCTSKPLKIEVLDPPAHGELSQETGMVPIGGLVTGSLEGCRGKEVEGIILYYKPIAGFRGNDTFRFKYRYVEPDDQPVIVTFTVTVE